MRWLTRINSFLFVSLFLLFWWLPLDQMPVWVMWSGIILTSVCALYLSLACRRKLATWRGFGVLVVALLLTLTWLNWQWALWQSQSLLLRNFNAAISLLAWAVGIGVGISSVLLLIYQDASVIFLAVSWFMCPILLLGVGTQYEQLAQLSATPLGQQLPWGVPFMWMVGVWCLAPPVFFVHLGIVVYREFKARHQPPTRNVG